jgi:hypothetical protein
MEKRHTLQLFWRCLGGECEKILLRPRNRRLAAAAAVICLVWAAVLWLLGGGVMPVTFSLSFSPLTVLAFLTELYLPICAVFLASDLFTLETAGAYTRWVRMNAAGPAVLFFAKFCAILLYCLANLFVFFGVVTCFSLLFPLRPLAASEIADALVAYAVSAVPLVPMAALAVLIANLARSGFLASVAGIGCYALLRAAAAFSPVLAKASFLSYLQWHVLWTGQTPSSAKLLNLFLLLSSGGIVLMIIGYLLFERKTRP